MGRKKRGKRSGEREGAVRDGESMRERERWGSDWVRDRERLLMKERERVGGGSERERKRKTRRV